MIFLSIYLSIYQQFYLDWATILFSIYKLIPSWQDLNTLNEFKTMDTKSNLKQKMSKFCKLFWGKLSKKQIFLAVIFDYSSGPSVAKAFSCCNYILGSWSKAKIPSKNIWNINTPCGPWASYKIALVFYTHKYVEICQNFHIQHRLF